MRPAFLATAVAAALGGTTALAAPPTSPGDLRVDVYSATAAELFWSRSTDPDGIVRGYEIRRDGALVDTRDGLSYFTDSLTDGQGATFTVTAVDFDGERSAPVSVGVVGGDRTGAVGAGGGRPTPPANLVSEIYSSSAAEVFWDRNREQRLRYEVSVDGRVVATTDGTSAFLSDLDGTRGRTVDVVAIDGNGQRSGSASVAPGGSGPSTPPSAADAPAAPSNLRVEIYSGSAFELFWTPPSDSTDPRYRISLDGEVVVSATSPGPRSSFFERGARGLPTTAEIRTVTRDGALSDPVGVEVSPTPPAAGDPDAPTTEPVDGRDSTFLPAALAAPVLASIEPGSPLSVANHETFLRAFYDIADPQLLDNVRRRLEALQAELRAAVAGADSRFVARSIASPGSATVETVFGCPEGGTVRTVFDDADAPTPRSVMDFDRCAVDGDTLSGITREVPNEFGADRTFGGYRLEYRLYPFVDDTIGLGDEGERFTVETATGLSTSFFGRGIRAAFPRGGERTRDVRRWRGNWQLDGAGTTLLVTDLYADNARVAEDDATDGGSSQPYFTVDGTVTNGRKVTTVNQSNSFRDIRQAGPFGGPGGVLGKQVFSDAQGGILDLVADLDEETGEQRTRVRIDTEGVILNRVLPAELGVGSYLIDR